jgi:hypothetical protein
MLGTAQGGIPTTAFTTLLSSPASTTLWLGIACIKVRVAQTPWLVVGTAIVPLNNEGLQPHVGWTLGFDRSF